jgi:hypothetical protein
MSRDETLARLEERRRKSQALARDMANVRHNAKGIIDGDNTWGGRVLRFFGGSAEKHFDRSSIEKSPVGKRWEESLPRRGIDAQTAEEMGIDTTKSWAANELALQLAAGGQTWPGAGGSRASKTGPLLTGNSLPCRVFFRPVGVPGDADHDRLPEDSFFH